MLDETVKENTKRLREEKYVKAEVAYRHAKIDQIVMQYSIEVLVPGVR
jgi:hypothetical protein